jgi:UDP-N-acetylmuramoyl-L-alanyl-D-glutamate--2,6-diaminopimelate ligase
MLTGANVPEGLSIVAATSDSRRVTPGSLFFAQRGVRSDGHDYARQAAARGAEAILGDRAGISVFEGVPYIYSRNPRRDFGLISHRLAGDPTRTMKVIGVTGTNGKSSSVYLIHRILREAGLRAGHFGTLGYCIGELTVNAEHTTPFAEDLAYLFQQARENKCGHVVMEVSSHAIEQERVAGIDFSVAEFTNLTQDHLDYHIDMNEYLRQKLRLFERIEGPDKFTVANIDDPSGAKFVAASRVRCITYGRTGDVRAKNVRVDLRNASFITETPWGKADIRSHLLGTHNVYNVLGAIAVCGGLKIPIETIAQGIESLASVPGRFEHIDCGQDFQVVVDYAHTEDGLRNVLQAAREICQGRVICVFGCGGDRDRTKRPKMGGVAAELADFCVVTSDNPRTESPEKILEDIETGLTGRRRGEDYIVIADRREAIQRSIETAQAGDLVMIAGKGHEDYQIVGTEKHHFDDREIARDLLEAIRA